MPILGSHQSIAGGLHHAVEDAHRLGFDCVQMFSKNSNQWTAKPLEPEAAAVFQAKLKELNVTHPLIHDSYLINLASPKEELYQKSVNAFRDEVQRAAALAVPMLVMHPGSYTESTEEEGLKRIADALDEVFRHNETNEVMVLLETTAGQGTNLGAKFEHLREIMDRCHFAERLGVCFDTCHVFAAGYPLREKSEYAATMKAFDDVIGLKHLRAFHLNDSVKGQGSRVDRHAHLGHGTLGVEPFRHILNDQRFAKVPMYLETPKGTGEMDGVATDWDIINLQTLRGLLGELPS
ncbi:MAG: deoxyribonuclease IV [Planctomycetaceae bacterium]|jgi:deoxyribonuclease-4|nr:deoxyribonuclease IV [Planctomycetaceae bacterium]